MEQATSRLNLSQAARRLYTSDGQIILDLDDLVEWVQDQYVKEARKQMRAEAKARRRQQQGGGGEEGQYRDVEVELRIRIML